MSSVPTSEAPSSGFDVARTLTFFFEDPNWVPKLVVGSLFAVVTPVLIGTVFLTGYAVALARHTMEGKTPALPEWDDFPSLLTDGLKGIALSIAHKLPIALLGLLMIFALVGGVLLGREGARAPEELAFVGVPALFGGFVVVFVMSLAILVYVPAAFVRFVRTGKLGAAFDFTANVDFIRANGSAYVMGLLAILLAGFIAQFGILLFCIGIFPAVFWSTCVFGYVVGELAKLPGEVRPS